MCPGAGIVRSALEHPGASSSAQERPGAPWNSQEYRGAPRSAQERPAAPSSAQQRPREPGSAQESPGAPRSARSAPERPRAPGAPWNVQASRSALVRPGAPGNAQERPGESDEESDEIPAPRKRKVVSGVVSGVLGKALRTCVWELCGSILCSKNECFRNFVGALRKFRLDFRRGPQKISFDISSGGSSNSSGAF